MQSEYEISNIKAGLEDCLNLIQSPVMQNLKSAILDSIAKLDEPMQLAIIGKISSSKSTLVNAILGKDELMSTGHKEVTYNVGWLKYGDPDSDIIIHYKDNRPPCVKSRMEFDRLSVDVTHDEIDEISYIELYDDAEILKEINIIDTPGLDANRERDSQNTLDFISRVRPDAVVMLFTHAVSENVLDVVSQFNSGASFNPLNAIGILSKIDVLWQETIPRDKSALQIGRKMVTNRKSKDAMIAKALFDLFPISALLYLAATTVTDSDVTSIQNAYEVAPISFMRSLNSMPKFLTNEENPMAEDDRKALVAKIGLYGIWLIAQRIKNGESIDLTDIKQLFFEESGAQDFRKTLYNHFGCRAKLIKIESVYQHLMQETNRLRAVIKNDVEIGHLVNIEQKLSDVFSSLVHEHKEYELLNKLYEGILHLDNDTETEFKNLCGENGNSAPEKLGLASGSDFSELINHALSREKHWRKEIALEPDPDEREWMKIILKSYSNLRFKITSMIYQYEQAKNFLLN